MSIYSDVINSPSYVFGYTLNGLGGGNSISADTSTELPVWIHLDYSANDCYELLEKLGLPEAAIESLTRSDTRPRSHYMEQGRILILRAVNMNPGASPEDMVSVRFWLEKNRLISLRQRKILSTQDAKKDLEEGKGQVDLEYLLVSIIEKMADRISDYVDSQEETLEKLELISDATNPITMRKHVIEIRRHSAAVRRYLSPQREAMESFTRQVRENIDNAHLNYLHEQADRIARYVEDLDLIKEKALLLQEDLINRIAQEQNSRMYVLSIIAAIFLPISFVTGLFGMNVGGLPGLENPKGFMFVAAFMVTVTTGSLLWFRKKRWL